MLSAQVHSCVVASRKAHTIGTIWMACKYHAYPVMMKFMLLGHKQTLAENRHVKLIKPIAVYVNAFLKNQVHS